MGETPSATVNTTVGVADGRLVIHTAPTGPPALLVAGDGVTILRGGQPAGARVEVRNLQGLTVDVGSCAPSLQMDVEVSADKLTGRLTVTRSPGLKYALRDQAEAVEVTLARVLLETTDPPEATVAAAHAALAKAGVVSGIVDEALAEAVAAADGLPHVVARGTPAQPGVDAVVEDTFGERRAESALFTVVRGTHLATKTPCVPGVEGRAVTGNPLPAPPPKDAPLAGGTGTTRTADDDGTVRLFAAVDGRPAHAGAMVLVEEKFTFGGDIDVATGDVEVFASVTIAGSVVEGRSVLVTHDLEVTGTVERAALRAGGSLTVGGSCMHSQLSAGGRQAVITRLLAALGEAPGELDQVAGIVEQLVGGAAARGQRLLPGPALLMLLEGRFTHVRDCVSRASSVVEEHSADTFDEAVVAALAAAHHVTVGLGMHELETPADLRAVVNRLALQVEALRHQIAEPSTVRTGYLQACSVEASGSLVITGQGIFNSDIFVAGDLLCEGSTSTLRGGRTRVGGIVRVHELGGDGGARMEVVLEGHTTTPDRLHADVVHPGVVVVANGVPVEFDTLRRDVLVGVDDEGRLRSNAA